jgi:hypothetical protein
VQVVVVRTWPARKCSRQSAAPGRTTRHAGSGSYIRVVWANKYADPDQMTELRGTIADQYKTTLIFRLKTVKSRHQKFKKLESPLLWLRLREGNLGPALFFLRNGTGSSRKTTSPLRSFPLNYDRLKYKFKIAFR